MQSASQLCGAVAIFFYSRGIFTNAGLDDTGATYAVVGTNVAGLAGTTVDVFILDRVGRRPLLLFTTAGIVVIFALLTVTLNLPMHQWAVNVSAACVVVFMALFAVGIGSLPSIITAEMFAQENRATALSVSTSFNWIFRIAVGMSFESIQEHMGPFCFIPFAVFMVVFFVFVAVFVSETRHLQVKEGVNGLKHDCTYCCGNASAYDLECI